VKKIVAIAVALVFSTGAFAQAAAPAAAPAKSEPSTMDKIKKHGEENTKAVNAAKAKKKADEEARSKANKEARDKKAADKKMKKEAKAKAKADAAKGDMKK